MLRHTLIALATAAALGAASPPCQAQRSPATPGPTPNWTAVAASLIGTVVPTAFGFAEDQGFLAFYGIFLGPSTGYFYSGRVGRGFASAGLRFGIAVAAGLGAMAACGDNWLWGCDDPTLADGITVVGLAGIAISAIYDISYAGNAARHPSEAHVAPDVSITPSVDVRQRAAGLNVRIAF